MKKQEFLTVLKAKLKGLPQKEMEERLSFYGEMIDDRMEEGLSEENAVLDMGSIDEIANQIIANTPLLNIVKEKITPKRRLRAWQIVLLAIGSPLWLSLMISLFAVILSLYAVIWSVVISVWAVFVSLAVVGVGGVLAGPICAVANDSLMGSLIVGLGFICLGLSIFAFPLCIWMTKGIVWLTKKMAIAIKKCFM